VRICSRNVDAVGAPAIRASPPEGREILLRLTTGDLMDDFQAALDADVEANPVLGNHDTDDEA
jgi:hypothetical protein